MIKLRDYTQHDTQILAKLANNAHVSQYLVYTFPHPYTIEDAEFWIYKGSRLNGTITKVIEYQDEFVGSIGISPQIGWREHCAEIGYWIGEPFWSKGIATEALSKMTNHIFTTYNINKLFAPVVGPNKASMKVLEKNNFVREGILKDEVRKNDQFYDLYYYAKFSE